MGEAKRKQELLERITEEVKRFGDRPIILELDLNAAFTIVGALQLALRHPQFTKMQSAAAVRAFVLEVRNQIPAEFQALRESIWLGFHPRFDE